MRFKIAALMFFIAATAISSMAQNKTVTNADLEKYRQARLAAEREYRENYERLGMPSPTELGAAANTEPDRNGTAIGKLEKRGTRT